MFTLTLKGLWSHKLRYALTGLAVVLGVAFMAGTMVLTDTMQATFDGVFASANDGTDVIVQRSGAIDGEAGTVRDRVDSGVVAQVAAVDGVDAAAGSVQGFGQLIKADGTVASEDGLGVTIGANWVDDERLNPFTLASGRAPEAGTEAILDEQTATDQGWELGDTFSVLTLTGPTEFTLVGTATYGALDGIPGSTMVATTDETAQALFAEPDRYDNVLVAAAEGQTPDELAERIVAEVATGDSGLEAITGEDDTAAKQDEFKDDMKFFNSFLMAFAYISLFVGTFIIYNTFSIVVAQRVKDLAMLRAIGARSGQVLRSVMLEAVVVGVTAAAVGLVAGIGLSFGLRALLAGVGLDIPDGALVVSTGTVVAAFTVGVVTSVLSAMVPAWRASRVLPIAALRDVAVDRSGVSLGRIVSGLTVTGAGVVAFAAGMTGDGSPDALALLGLGAVVTILGVFVLGPVLVRPVVKVLGAPIAASGVTGNYATENARRTPKRTAATASALMIGVALVGIITIVASSTSASIGSAVDRAFRSDYVIDSGSWARGFATSVEDDLAAVDAIDTMSPLRSGVAEVDGSTNPLMAVDTTTIDGLYDLDVTAGDMADVGADGVAVTADRALADGLELGDTVTFGFADGSEAALAVRAIYAADVPADGDWMLDVTTLEAHSADQFDTMLFVSIDDGVVAADARTDIESAMTDWPNAAIQDQAEFKESVTSEIDMMLNLIYGLLALAVLISLIGIANTLALSVHERTRELGLLRAVGMHRRQLRRAVRWEALLISGMGATLGAVLAVGGAYGIVEAMETEGVTQLVIPGTRLAVIVALAGLAGVVAATTPARRASKLDVLEALSAD